MDNNNSTHSRGAAVSSPRQRIGIKLSFVFTTDNYVSTKSCSMFRFRLSNVTKFVFYRIIQVRELYGVQHSARREIFYVRLKDQETAVLSYKADGKILDIRSINVPRDYQGHGLARLLAEAAFTYAIVNDYYMLLTCEYAQKFYLSTRTAELEERVIGPKNILENLPKPIKESIDNLQDPEDSLV